ncbi:hypothetical protein ABT203_07935 [Streptomyces sp900105245]
MTEEETPPNGHCAQCERRRSIRQALVDWMPVIVVVIKEVVQYFPS